MSLMTAALLSPCDQIWGPCAPENQIEGLSSGQCFFFLMFLQRNGETLWNTAWVERAPTRNTQCVAEGRFSCSGDSGEGGQKHPVKLLEK